MGVPKLKEFIAQAQALALKVAPAGRAAVGRVEEAVAAAAAAVGGRRQRAAQVSMCSLN